MPRKTRTTKHDGKKLGRAGKPSRLPARLTDGAKRRITMRRRHQGGQLVTTKNGWSVRYRLHGEGQRKRVQRFLGTFAQLTRPMAKHAMNKVLAEVNEHPAGHPQTSTQTFGYFAEKWIEGCENRKLRPVKISVLHGWRNILRNHLLPLLDAVPLADVGNRTMRSVVERLAKKGLAPTTIRNICLVLKLVRASAIDEDGNQLFPIKWNAKFVDAPEIDPSKLKRPSFVAEQVTQIVQAATGRLQIICIAAAATGMRIGELLGAECRHVGESSIKVEQSVWQGRVGTPKTQNSFRVVDVHPAVSALLNQYIGNRKAGFIFQTHSRRPLSQTNLLKRELHPLLRNLGIPTCGFHSFRRFRNTFLRQSRCPDALLKFWLGHSGRDMSDVYDRSREDVQYRKDVAKSMGHGFRRSQGSHRAASRRGKNVTTGRYWASARSSTGGRNPLLTQVNIEEKLG
jgi:integrase